jgi:hypothetical protein
MIGDSTLKEDKKDITVNSSHVLQLKYTNPEGDSSIGFRYSRYRDSEAGDKNLSKDIQIKSKLGCWGKFWKQVGLMSWKNWLVFSRNLKPTLFLFSTPVAICLLLILLQTLVNNFSEGLVNRNPDLIPLTNLDRCMYPNDCTTIGYGVIVK